MKVVRRIFNLLRRQILKLPRLGGTNQNPLLLNDFSGYNQPFHPSVIYHKDGLYGYRYWMVQTPYPIGGRPYRARWECPSIYCSNNGIDWETKRYNNPIDDLTPDEIENGDYFSDPHLVYRDDTGELECWYRLTHMDMTKEKKKLQYPTYLIRKRSGDGVN